MNRYRIVIGFLSNDPTIQRAIITFDDRLDVITQRVKEISEDFQILSTNALGPTENGTIRRNPRLFEKVYDHEELKRQMEHHRRPEPKVLPVITKKKTQPPEEAKIVKMGRTSLVNRMKSRIW